MVSVHKAVEFVLLSSRCWEGVEEGGLRDRAGGFLSSAYCHGLPLFLLPLFHKVIWLVTFTSAIFLGLDVGLLVSVGFAFFIVTVQSHRYFVSGTRRLAMVR